MSCPVAEHSQAALSRRGAAGTDVLQSGSSCGIPACSGVYIRAKRPISNCRDRRVTSVKMIFSAPSGRP